MPSMRRRDLLPLLLASSGGLVSPLGGQVASGRSIIIWHGNEQRVGHLGDAQDDFNIMGHVPAWRELDSLQFRINGATPTPLFFRAYRRLAADGDFNADVPIGSLRPGQNVISVRATFRDGETSEQSVVVHRATGTQKLPLRIEWSKLSHFQDAGQAVDGNWELTPAGLRTRQISYDRVFLIGERTWKDYDVKTSVTIHAVPDETSPISGGNGLGIILRFAGHVVGGPRAFPSGQPKWGYQPFGAIGWLRWTKGRVAEGPHTQFYPGDSDKWENIERFPVTLSTTYRMRFRCQSLPDAADGRGVTRYSYKVWPGSEDEPDSWAWQRVQTSEHALRQGGFTLLAHHVDATFGDVEVTSVDL